MSIIGRVLLTDGELAAYAVEVARKDDADLISETRDEIRHAGYCRFHSRHDQRVTVLWREFGARGKPHLYQRAYNQAAMDCGYEVDVHDLDRAKAPVAA